MKKDSTQTSDSKPKAMAVEEKVEKKINSAPIKTGQIVLTIYKAKDVEKKGMFGKAYPYVELTLGKQQTKSATVKKQS